MLFAGWQVGLYCLFSYILRNHLPKGWCHPQWAILCYINEQLRQALIGLPAGYFDLDISLIFSSKKILDCAKLKLTRTMTSHRFSGLSLQNEWPFKKGDLVPFSLSLH